MLLDAWITQGVDGDAGSISMPLGADLAPRQSGAAASHLPPAAPDRATPQTPIDLAPLVVLPGSLPLAGRALEAKSRKESRKRAHVLSDFRTFTHLMN